MARTDKPKGSPKGEPAKTKGEAAKPHELLLMPVAQNAIAMDAWGKYAGEANLADMVEGLGEKTKKVQDGDMRSVEAMLYGQAMTLQTMFTNLARRAANQEYLKQFHTHMTLALKAQAQCRSTLEALAQVKNPMPYIKQANIASGPQQVNNGKPEQYAQAHAPAGDSQTLQNKLLEHQHGNTLEFGAQGTAGGANPHMATVD
jgi:hypothetical protein